VQGIGRADEAPGRGLADHDFVGVCVLDELGYMFNARSEVANKKEAALAVDEPVGIVLNRFGRMPALTVAFGWHDVDSYLVILRLLDFLKKLLSNDIKIRAAPSNLLLLLLMLLLWFRIQPSCSRSTVFYTLRPVVETGACSAWIVLRL
jgi:hypothetical protein